MSDAQAFRFFPHLPHQALWLAAFLAGTAPADDALAALGADGRAHFFGDDAPAIDLFSFLRRAHAVRAGRSAARPLRIVAGGPGDPPRLPAGTRAAELAAAAEGAVVLDAEPGAPQVAVVPVASGPDEGEVHWQTFEYAEPLPAPDYLSPGEADLLLAEATRQAAGLIEASGLRPLAHGESPRLTVGRLDDFVEVGYLPPGVPTRAVKLLARGPGRWGAVPGAR
ncbi:hypothetical protein [Corynebacterium atypicum]|uniref:hypothetical protein n=1 Tax=Corynebacterium atypicum TaxID=191610 RepID=UPI00068B38A5|nr:hypothetical protein [Corynebacterium atypicum]